MEKTPFSFRAYCQDALGGIRYLRRGKGIRSIYTYMAVVNSAAQGNKLMAIAYFQSNPALGAALPYQTVPPLMSTIGLLTVYFLIIRNKRYIQPIYEKDA